MKPAPKFQTGAPTSVPPFKIFGSGSSSNHAWLLALGLHRPGYNPSYCPIILHTERRLLRTCAYLAANDFFYSFQNPCGNLNRLHDFETTHMQFSRTSSRWRKKVTTGAVRHPVDKLSNKNVTTFGCKEMCFGVKLKNSRINEKYQDQLFEWNSFCVFKDNCFQNLVNETQNAKI